MSKAGTWVAPNSLYRLFGDLGERYLWGEQEAPWEAEQIRHVVDTLRARKAAPNEWVLDAGCGTGNCTIALGHAGFYIIGIDWVDAMLAQARTKVLGNLPQYVNFFKGNLDTSLEFSDAHFHHVVSIGVLQTVAKPLFTLSELHRVLKPGGTLILTHHGNPPTSARQNISRTRTHHLARKSPWQRLMVTAKTVGGRQDNTHQWTGLELHDMLRMIGFRMILLEEDPVIMIVAEKL